MTKYSIEASTPTAILAEKISGPKTAGFTYLPEIVVRLEAAGGAQNAFAVSKQNPFGVDMMIVRAVFVLDTKGATASAVLDVDVDADGATGGDTILDGVAIGSGATEGTVSDSQDVANSGTNATELPKVWHKAGGSNDYITAKIMAAAAAALVGRLYLFCVPKE